MHTLSTLISWLELPHKLMDLSSYRFNKRIKGDYQAVIKTITENMLWCVLI